MKIVLVVHSFWPNYQAGTENHTYFLAQELAKKHEVFVFAGEPNSKTPGKVEEYQENGFSICKIHLGPIFVKKIEDTYQNKKLDKVFDQYLKKIKPEVVHFQHLINLSLGFIDVAQKNQAKLFFSIHDFWFQCPGIRRYYRANNCSGKECSECLREIFPHMEIKKQNIQQALQELKQKRFVKRIVTTLSKIIARLDVFLNDDYFLKAMEKRNKIFLNYFSKIPYFITPSLFLTKELTAFGVNKKKIFTIGHGIRLPLIYKNKKVKPKKYLEFYFISHITRDKGFFILIENFLASAQKFKNIRLKIYGSYDKNDSEITRMVESFKNSDCISYEGSFENKNVHRILRNADVVIVPSLWNEIYGLVIDEAFFNNAIVIASKRGGITERVKDKKNGLLFEPDHKLELSQKINFLARNPAIVNKLAKNKPEIKSIKQYAKEIKAIYQSAL